MQFSPCSKSEFDITTDAVPIASVEEAESLVADSAFKSGARGRVGVELEWLVNDRDNAAGFVTPGRILSIASGPEIHGQLSTEPGGQLELSSLPASMQDCVSQTLHDMTVIRDKAAADGVALLGIGLDPHRPPRLQVDSPRYNAMVSAFDAANDAGRLMLCSTSSVQVSIEAGQE